MPFKCSYNVAPGYLCSNLLQRTNIHDRLTRNHSSFKIPLFKTASGQRSFTYRAVKIWIDLDDLFKLQPSISALDDTHINREAVCLFVHHKKTPTSSLAFDVFRPITYKKAWIKCKPCWAIHFMCITSHIAHNEAVTVVRVSVVASSLVFAEIYTGKKTHPMSACKSHNGTERES